MLTPLALLPAALVMQTCPPGNACPTGAINYQQCSAGTYADQGSPKCSECAKGTFQGSAGQRACKPCSAGECLQSGSRLLLLPGCLALALLVRVAVVALLHMRCWPGTSAADMTPQPPAQVQVLTAHLPR